MRHHTMLNIPTHTQNLRTPALDRKQKRTRARVTISSALRAVMILLGNKSAFIFPN